MTTEYHDNAEEDNSFWSKEPRPVYFSGVSRFRRWLFPGLTAIVVLVIVIALGASNATTTGRLWSLDKTVSNLTEMLSTAQQLNTGAVKEVNRLKFVVEKNREQLSSVSDALQELVTLDSVSREVAKLRCVVDHLINNGSLSDGCCPLHWDAFGSSCYFFSKTLLNWHEAREWCDRHDGHLVILQGDKEWDHVTRLAAGVSYWVGLTDERGQWEWVNQTPYVMNRRRWRPGQPDAWTHHGLGPGDEDCAHLFSDSRLNDLHCSSRLRYICQKHRTRS